MFHQFLIEITFFYCHQKNLFAKITFLATFILHPFFKNHFYSLFFNSKFTFLFKYSYYNLCKCICLCILVLEQNNRNIFFDSEIFDMNNLYTFDSCVLIKFLLYCAHYFNKISIDIKENKIVLLIDISSKVLNILSFYRNKCYSFLMVNSILTLNN
jgi:hypothetical protein